MKLASKVRHLEVQVLADQYGNTISIYGRCVSYIVCLVYILCILLIVCIVRMWYTDSDRYNTIYCMTVLCSQQSIILYVDSLFAH